MSDLCSDSGLGPCSSVILGKMQLPLDNRDSTLLFLNVKVIKENTYKAPTTAAHGRRSISVTCY